jgi:hypothetical protein
MLCREELWQALPDGVVDRKEQTAIQVKAVKMDTCFRRYDDQIPAQQLCGNYRAGDYRE